MKMRRDEAIETYLDESNNGNNICPMKMRRDEAIETVHKGRIGWSGSRPYEDAP